MSKLHLIIFISIVYTNLLISVNSDCSNVCICDMYKNFRRATCSKRNLIMVDSDIPSEAQILDLSYNRIKEIEARIFSDMKLHSMVSLNISHNKIGQIHMNAFDGLDELEVLDLSSNIIQYFLPSWLLAMGKLERLYLQRNNLHALSADLLKVTSPHKNLKVLDVSYCNIAEISPRTFIFLPNLENLSIAGNHLLKFDVNVIKPLRSLKLLNASNNSFKCDVHTKLEKYCNERSIQYEDPCLKKEDNEMFQRMILVPSNNETNQILDTGWTFNNSTKEDCTNLVVKKSILLSVLELSPTIFLLVSFLSGLVVGLLIGCSPNVLRSKRVVHKRKGVRKKIQRTISLGMAERGLKFNERDMKPLCEDFGNLGSSTPMMQRRV